MCVFFLQQKHLILLLLCERKDNKFLFMETVTLLGLARRSTCVFETEFLWAGEMTECLFAIDTSRLTERLYCLRESTRNTVHFDMFSF